MATWIRSGLTVAGIFGAAVAVVALLTVQASEQTRQRPRPAVPAPASVPHGGATSAAPRAGG